MAVPITIVNYSGGGILIWCRFDKVVSLRDYNIDSILNFLNLKQHLLRLCNKIISINIQSLHILAAGYLLIIQILKVILQIANRISFFKNSKLRIS